MSFGGQGGASGEIRYVISVDDSQAVQKLQSVSQQFQQMPRALDQATASTGKFSQANADMAAELQATDIGAKNAVQSTQSFGSVVRQNIGTVVSMASGILGVVSSYISLQRTQLQINKLQVTEANQVRMLGVLHRAYEAAVRKEGATSQKAMDIKAKIDILDQRHANTLEQITIRQEQQTQAQLSFGISLIQTGASLVQMATQLKGYKGAADTAAVATTKLTMSIRALKIATVIGSILVAIEIAAQAVARNFGGIQQKLDEFYNWAVKVAPALRPVINAIWTIGQALTAIFTGDLDALNKMFAKSPPLAEAAQEGIEGVGEAVHLTDKAAEEAADKIKDFWKSLHEGALTDVGVALKVKKPDVDKFTKKLLDYMPDKVEKDVKIKIKGEQSVATAKESIEKVFDLAINGANLDEQTVDSYVTDWIKMITEKLPDNAQTDQLRKELAAAVAGDNTEQRVRDLIQKWHNLISPDATVGTTVGTTIATNVGKGFTAGMFKFNPDTALGEGESMLGKNHNKQGGIFKGILDNLLDRNLWVGAGSTIVGWIQESFSGQLKTGSVSPGSNLSISIAKGLLNRPFWLQVGTTITGWILESKVNQANSAIWLAGLAAPLLDSKFWTSLGTTLTGWILESKINQANTVSFLANLAGPMLDLKFWKSTGATILGFIFEGLTSMGKTVTGGVQWIYDQMLSVIDKFKDLGMIIGDKIIQGIKSIPEAFASVWNWIYNKITGQGNTVPNNKPTQRYGRNGKPIGEGLTDKDLQAMLDKNTRVRTPQSDAAEILNANIPDSDKKALLAAIAKKYGYDPGRTSQFGFDELFPQKQPYGNFTPSPDHHAPNPSNLYGREHLFSSIAFSGGGFAAGIPPGDIQGQGIIGSWAGMNGTQYYDPEYARRGTQYEQKRQAYSTAQKYRPAGAQPWSTMGALANKPGVGQQILDAAGSGQFAQIAVGAQLAQKALANLAVQGGKSFQILANLILKNTTNLMGNFVTIAKQSQLAQTALANLAVQGGKSFQILANLILANTSNLLGNFTTINTNTQKSQTALANLANQGSNSFSILQSSAAQHTKSLNTYMGKTIPVAAQKSQKALANLSNEGSNSMSLLAKNSGKHTKSMNTYLAKTIPVAAQKSQTSLANLSNEGSKSMKALADATEKAASRIKSALNSIPSGGGGGGFSGFDGGGFNFASGGDFITSGPQMIMVGESGRERVTVTPLGANASSGNGIGGATVNQTISLNISGSDLINQRNLTKRIKLTVGEQRDKFG